MFLELEWLKYYFAIIRWHHLWWKASHLYHNDSLYLHFNHHLLPAHLMDQPSCKNPPEPGLDGDSTRVDLQKVTTDAPSLSQTPVSSLQENTGIDQSLVSANTVHYAELCVERMSVQFQVVYCFHHQSTRNWQNKSIPAIKAARKPYIINFSITMIGSRSKILPRCFTHIWTVQLS